MFCQVGSYKYKVVKENWALIEPEISKQVEVMRLKIYTLFFYGVNFFEWNRFFN